MLRHRRLQALVATAALAGTTALAGPASAADSTVTWRPGSTPTGTGFWSHTCGSDATPEGSLNADKAGVTNITKPVVVSGSGIESAWQFPTTSTTQVGPSASVDNTLTGVSLDASGPASGRLVIRYVKPGLLGTHYVRYAALPISFAAGWNTFSASASTSIPVYGNAISSSSSVGKKSLSWISSDIGSGNTAVLAVEVGCSSSPATIDHFKVSRSTGTTDYDMASALSTTTLTASATRIAPGGTATLATSVLDNYTHAAPAAGTVTLQSAPSGSSTFTDLTTLTGGTSKYAVTPKATTQYRLAYSGSAATAASQSAVVTVQIQPTITATLSTKTVTRGSKYTVSGTTNPARGSVTVSLQQTSAGSWTTVATAKTKADGSYSITRTATGSGSQQLRVLLSSSGGNATATSPTLTLRTQVRTTIALTVTPARPKPGAKVTITGSINPLRSGVKVRLQRAVGSKWKAIATTTTNAKGRFSHTMKAPGPGALRIRATTAAAGANLAGTSATRTVVVTVKTSTTAKAVAKSTTVGKAFAVTGVVKPHHRAQVVLQLKVKGKWLNLAVAKSAANGRYRATATATVAGTWRMRTVLVPTAGYVTSHSKVVVMTVRAAPVHTGSSGGTSSGGSTGGTSGGVGHG